jgi:hypothetical protein
MLAAVKSSFIAALLYWWFAIFRPQDWIWWNVSSLKLPLLAAIIFIPPALARGYLPKIDNKLAAFMSLWFLLALLAYLTTGCRGVGPLAGATQGLAILILVVLITERLMSNQQKFLYLVAIVGLSLGFHAGKSGLNNIFSGGASSYGADNLTGLFSGSNAFAMGSGMLLFYIIFVYQQIKNPLSLNLLPEFLQSKTLILKIIKWGLLLTIIGTVYNVIALFSRGAALATFVGLFAMAALHPDRKKIFSFGIPLLLIALIVIPIPEGYEERISSIFEEKEELDNSAASRPHFWGVAAAITKDHPFGVGPGCYMDFYNDYDPTNGQYGRFRSVHSSHFQILTESGYAGFALWILLIFTAWSKQLKIRKLSMTTAGRLSNPRFYADAATMLICSQLVFVLGGAFYEWAHNDIIWLSWGITIALERILNRELDANPINQ